MQPFYIEPHLPVQIASAFMLALMGVAFLLVLAKQEAPTRLRMLTAAVVVGVFVVARTYAADQYLPNPCDSCASASGILWWILGCWAC